MLKNLKEQPKYKLVIAGIILLGALYIIIGNPRNNDYLQEVEEEIILAKKICENSIEQVLGASERLKMDENLLRDILVDGETIELKRVKYPRIIFLHTGYKHKGAHNELYCSFTDPRNKAHKYYFDYDTKSWVTKTRTRR